MTVVMTVTTTAATAETRTKRETSQLNELAYRVLSSIDNMMKLQEGGACLGYTLCNNNKYSRALNNNNRLWLPVWRLVYRDGTTVRLDKAILLLDLVMQLVLIRTAKENNTIHSHIHLLPDK